ncbi:MAG: glycosyl transferase 4, partial [Lachnospiraceae bacterium]
MKILWLCNIMLPVVAEHLHRETSNKEGWLTGLSTAILDRQEENEVELAVTFPVERELDGCHGIVETPAKLHYYGFYENTVTPERYDEGLEEKLQQILRDFEPDL